MDLAVSPIDHRHGQVSVTIDHLQQLGEHRLDAIRNTFNRWVRTGKAAGMERRHKRLAELMLKRVDMQPAARVLDIGCGDGWVARLLADQLADGAFVGIDVSDEMIRTARRTSEQLDNVLFAPAPAEQIPWADDYFTHVLSIESAYYWVEPRLVAKEIYRVAAYGGSFHVLINYYTENPYSKGWDADMGLAMHRLSRDLWAELFRESGFQDISTMQIPDDSSISPGKSPEELATRKGLQRVGALYITGRKPALPKSSEPVPDPFRVLR